MKNLPYILIIICLSLSLRIYTIGAGMPYFYDEDEAHHFNRSVNMAKNVEFNPNYFHKPSLHFYLRMPVVWASYFWSKQKGYLQNIDEIRTYNKYGIAGYAFTASHPGIVKWNRSLSLLFSITMILLTFLIAKKVSKSDSCSFLAALAACLSPPLISYSGVIGVDTLMSMMCLIASLFSIKFAESKRTRDLVWACIFSGLAVSSKYNALPIVAAPFVACLVNRNLSIKNFLICCLLPALAFFSASPYILISLPTFINDLTYEIWHYSTAGHEGHTANPGIDQILFYSTWFYTEALGAVFSALALLGLLLLTFRKDKPTIVFLSFPVLYFLMMIMQKANFVRNMLVILPFLCIFALYAVLRTLKALNVKRKRIFLYLGMAFLLGAGQPLRIALEQREVALERPESRNQLSKWILQENNTGIQTGVSGELQVPPNIPLTLSNFTTIDEKTVSAYQLWLDGYDRIILPRYTSYTANKPLEGLKLVNSFFGNKEETRIIENPEIEVLDFKPAELNRESLKKTLRNCEKCRLKCELLGSEYKCSQSRDSAEDYAWLQKRITVIEIPGLSGKLDQNETMILSAEIMSPWKNEFGIFSDSNSEKRTIEKVSDWQNYDFKVSKADLYAQDSLAIYVKQISSPFKLKLSTDKRMLGAAIKHLRIQ